jgi:GxxExxY protein
MDDGLIEEKLTRSVIGAFFEVYNILDFGFLENVYLTALGIELAERAHEVVRESCVGVIYKRRRISAQRLDMVVDGKLIVEVKSTEHLPPTAIRQLDNYLKGTGLEVGLLLHFGPQAKFYRRIRTDKTKLPTTND